MGDGFADEARQRGGDVARGTAQSRETGVVAGTGSGGGTP
ncbi:MAG: hypothetical protein AVDCRST_MAG19-2591 [uncultured Thermomicrobiales bacterium]|uniref:Uncharacterized protein n=1 Tax=uncultured Thermomicrobiales bacterium TaxID=1645740 RepID=A0A6J4V728_9BACT|nr:MAG: hypothetical protein AVDCRST_MAG19-2591 [uncultured Thermomicrobiales bacterium]